MNPRPTFDRIAASYDLLAWMVFGKSILRSAEFFLEKTQACNTILVLGGGTGKFLPYLVSLNPACTVYYIDASPRMLARAKQRTRSTKIHFIHGTEASIPANFSFDAVLTFYYLDLFENETLDRVVTKIRSSLASNALWLTADFVDRGKWWQGALLTCMYFFFRVSCGLQTRTLPEWRVRLSASGFDLLSAKPFTGGFIESAVYRRSFSPAC